MTVVPGFLAQLPFVGIFFGAFTFLMIPLQIMGMMAYPIMLFNPGIKFEPAINLVIDGIAKNISNKLVIE